ncbi:hypothetical protein Hlac_2749 [Halorubrum lacusprofundi ATCC 49239]|uniref:Uncharacterized protein n=1 Tax=Halorubrum lacusprofundi (strain ATCC 49239 / DSM 5036 / JCM 8891 / ACAM 34) TaxID=416348 RepID=B9LVT0_HALLT|nr:hypothetical protein Hlac_2749 [Halorubrum lacusprofundi ATCC 49239]
MMFTLMRHFSPLVCSVWNESVQELISLLHLMVHLTTYGKAQILDPRRNAFEIEIRGRCMR